MNRTESGIMIWLDLLSHQKKALELFEDVDYATISSKGLKEFYENALRAASHGRFLLASQRLWEPEMLEFVAELTRQTEKFDQISAALRKEMATRVGLASHEIKA